MRRATALPMTLYAMALIGALVIGSSFIARRLAADARLVERGAELEPTTEQAVVESIASWDSAGRASQTVGSAIQLAAPDAERNGGGVWITRLSPSVYWLVAEVQSAPRPALWRRVGTLISVKNGVPTLVRGRAWGELP